MTRQTMLRVGVAVGVAAVLAAAGCAAKPTTAVRPAPPGASASPPAGPLPSTDGDSQSASSTPTPGATTAPRKIQRCHTRDLTGHVEGHGAGAGQRYAALGVTNKTATSCTIYGYPGLQLVDAYRQDRQTTARWDSTEATLLVVRPRQTVWALLHWTVVPADDEVATDCAPDTAGLRVIPPDETTPLNMGFDPGPLCQHGLITVSAFGRDRPADG